MKKLLLMSLFFVSGSVFAQSPNFIQRCTDPNGGIIFCQMGSTPGSSVNTTPTPDFNLPGIDLPGAITPIAAPDINASYDSRYPGNVFAFCSSGRPGRSNPMRKVYDSICPAGKM